MSGRDTIPIGTRKSALAIAQTVQVQEALERLNPTKSFPLLRMSTTGDNNQGQPLSSIGTTALFTRELEVSLEKHECHLLVHSLKDVPTQVKPGFVIGAMLKREEPNDVMVMRRGEFKDLKDFGSGDVIGTSSVRRASQIRRLCPGVQVMDVVSCSLLLLFFSILLGTPASEICTLKVICKKRYLISLIIPLLLYVSPVAPSLS